MYQEREEEDNQSVGHEDVKAELAEAKEELMRAKESAMQSWLDSKPLIDELERQKANLADAQQSSNTSETDIAELELKLEIILESIKSKREDQLKTERMIDEMNHVLDQTRNEMERLKLEEKKEKQTRAKLRQTLHLRRNTAQTLQLTLQAVLLESDVVEESTAEALQEINHSESHTAAIQLTREDYHALKRKAGEKISRANWLISASMEQKLAAEATRELASSRLNKFYSNRSLSTNRRNKTGEWCTEKGKRQEAIVEEEVATNIESASPTSNAKSLAKFEGGKPQQSRGSRISIKTVKKKPSFLYKMRKCLEGWNRR